MHGRDILGGPDRVTGMDIMDGAGRRCGDVPPREGHGDILGPGGKAPGDILLAGARPETAPDILSGEGSSGAGILAGK